LSSGHFFLPRTGIDHSPRTTARTRGCDAGTVRRKSDPVLRLLESLPDEGLAGDLKRDGLSIAFAEESCADELYGVAHGSMEAWQVEGVCDAGMRIDPRPPSDAASRHADRADMLWSIGLPAASRALLLHDLGHDYARAGRWREAARQFVASARIDPVFAWSLNDAAWMIATTPDEDARCGEVATRFAEEAAAARHWGCWAMLDSFAAALALDDDFPRAVAWQRQALRLCRVQRPAEVDAAAARLALLEAGRAIVDEAAEIVPASGHRLAALARRARILAQPYDLSLNPPDIAAQVRDAGLHHPLSGLPTLQGLREFLDAFDDAMVSRILRDLSDPRAEGAVAYRRLDREGHGTGPHDARVFGSALPLETVEDAMRHEIAMEDGGCMYPVAIYRAPWLPPVQKSTLVH
jgi:hypothetical protein